MRRIWGKILGQGLVTDPSQAPCAACIGGGAAHARPVADLWYVSLSCRMVFETLYGVSILPFGVHCGGLSEEDQCVVVAWEAPKLPLCTHLRARCLACREVRPLTEIVSLSPSPSTPPKIRLALGHSFSQSPADFEPTGLCRRRCVADGLRPRAHAHHSPGHARFLGKDHQLLQCFSLQNYGEGGWVLGHHSEYTQRIRCAHMHRVARHPRCSIW